ncbi:hypothetical protein C8J56DRAFT_1169404 [Mycena floridula]|nr:hypothetical protein C8J56DRAFT_1169404 [Mycena floridula]
MSAKRPRIPSPSPSASSSSGSAPTGTATSRRLSSSPTAKSTRLSSPESRPSECRLPPTCNRNPTLIANAKDLEAHYANFHAHVCEVPGCKCVFPVARLLELHQTECHDPLAAIRQGNGEKIFACHLPVDDCGKVFLTPKARRLHMISSHAYPKQYFFAVTNKGVGGLLKKWGQGASMIRGEWKPREGQDKGKQKEQTPEERERAIKWEKEREKERWKAAQTVDEAITEAEDEDGTDGEDTEIEEITEEAPQIDETTKVAMDSITDSMSSLSMVPSSIRFGRGAKNINIRPRPMQVDNARGIASPRGRGSFRGPARDFQGGPMDVDRPVPARGRGGAVGTGPPRGGIIQFPRGRGRGAGWVPRGMARGRGRGFVAQSD